MNQRTRASIVVIAGLYILYLAYDLFRNRNEPTTMAMPIMILFIVLFAVAGIYLLYYAWRTWKLADKEEKQQRDDNALK
ncbi:MAG: hypothetical protein Q4C54_05045 [Clostridia bacterium]|nr:hypothetical protein [Clostridia bacterium]